MDATSHPRSHSWLEIPQWECWLLFLPHHEHRHWSEEMTNPATWAPASSSVSHLPVGYQRARSSNHSESLSHPPAFFGRTLWRRKFHKFWIKWHLIQNIWSLNTQRDTEMTPIEWPLLTPQSTRMFMLKGISIFTWVLLGSKVWCLNFKNSFVWQKDGWIEFGS